MQTFNWNSALPTTTDVTVVTAASRPGCMHMGNFDDMVRLVEHVARVNSAVILPKIQAKEGLDVVSCGADYGEIVTVADQKVSQYLLNGGLEGVPAMRSIRSGSFSEEDDAAEARRVALEVDEVDPMDGTGDLKKTYQTDNVMGSTTLVARLQRTLVLDDFTPKAGLIFDNITQTALVSDGLNIGLYRVDTDGKLHEAKFEFTGYQPTSDTLRLSQRHAYHQHNADVLFPAYLRDNDVNVKQIPVGGAGRIALQFFRNYIQPTDKHGDAFAKLEPIDLIFNRQPDWKTWDTDPTEVIANALKLNSSTDIYGQKLTANAAKPTLKDMHHTKGYALSPYDSLHVEMCHHARAFEKETGVSLLEKNY